MSEAISNLPAIPQAEENLGFDSVSGDSVQIPFIQIDNNSKFLDQEVPGFKKGCVFNSTTQTVYPDGFVFVPVFVYQCWVEWTPREAGSRRVAIYSNVTGIKLRQGEFPNYHIGPNQLVETFYVYAISEALEFVVIPITRTKIAPYKAWMKSLLMFRDDNGKKRNLMSHLTRLKSVKQTRRGHDFYNAQFVPANETLHESLISPEEEIYSMAVDAYFTAKALCESADSVSESMKKADSIEAAYSEVVSDEVF